MDIKIGGRNLKVTEGMADYARRKVDRLDRYLPNIREVRVDLARQNNSRGEDVHIAQLTVLHDRGAILRAEEKCTGEIHVAIDLAVDKLYRQIERFKGKRIVKRRQGGRYQATPEELQTAEMLPVEVDATIPVTAPSPSEFEVVRRKQIELIPMDENEAIEQMELLAHSFFMFYNVDTGKVNVLYRRYDGGYGLLEPSH